MTAIFDVVVDNEELNVLGPPSQIDVSVDIGQQGVREYFLVLEIQILFLHQFQIHLMQIFMSTSHLEEILVGFINIMDRHGILY